MNGKIQDLGTLGGSDSVVYQTNNSRQAMGISFTDNVRHESRVFQRPILSFGSVDRCTTSVH